MKTFTKPLRQIIALIAKDTSITCEQLDQGEFFGYGLPNFPKGKHVTIGNLANELRRNCMTLTGGWLEEEEENTFLYMEKAGFHIVNWG